jgi:hypothetical protein
VLSTKARANGSLAPKGNSGKTLIPQSGMTTAKYPGQSPIDDLGGRSLISAQIESNKGFLPMTQDPILLFFR